MSGARAIGAGLLFFGLASGVASTALDYWFYLSTTHKGDTMNIYFGLWQFCGSETAAGRCCQYWNKAKDAFSWDMDLMWLYGCQALMILGCFLNTVAAFAAIYVTLKHASVKAVQGLSVASAICYIIAAVIFVVKYESLFKDGTLEGGTLHAGFGLAIGAAVVNSVPVYVLASPQARISV